MSNWYQQEAAAVLKALGVDPQRGLDDNEAAQRLKKYGPNELIETGRKGPWRILWDQLTSVLVVILIVAAVISGLVGDLKDTIAILAIVVLNTILGFVQEYRAEKAMAALKQLAAPTVRARRNGRTVEIPSREIVPGDIVLLEAGNMVPADGRLIESVNLRAEEAALTGESAPVEKDAAKLQEADLPVGDRRNMVYMGTVATYGRGVAVITATGMQTELGAIARMIQTVEHEPTPLERRLDQLGKALVLLALVIVAVVFITGWLQGGELRVLLMTAISLMVAAVPESLPAVVTIALALGAQRMLKRRALIRKLPAVETLGSVTTICSDKTGTLTENRITATTIQLAERRVTLDGAAGDGEQVAPAVELLLTGAALCNDAELDAENDGSGALQAIGDPTETALVVAAARQGFEKAELEKKYPRIAELPFDSERKRMTTVHEVAAAALPAALGDGASGRQTATGAPHIVFTKGGVDSLLDRCAQVWADSVARPLDEAERERIISAHEQLAGEGMRVLGVAFRLLDARPAEVSADALERDLTFLGQVAMIDPLRQEAKGAVATCKAAGIRPVMITGDHPQTARQIAGELGMLTNDRILTGQELERMSAQELEAVVEDVSVYARVSPEHKLKIVEALQARGEIVAMTGDGVNDAPALKKADIGVAMGLKGTDVSKEASDLVLLDDNFATIVAAVEEGRLIYDNIRKFIKYVVTGNCGKLWMMLVGPFIGIPLPLLPLQILWINFVTDGLPGLALSVEPAERDIMKRPPRHPNESLLGRGMGAHILTVGLLSGSLALGVGYAYWRSGNPAWQTMIFLIVVLAQMGQALAIRSGRDSIFHIGFLSNRPLFAVVILTAALQIAVVYVPVLQGVFRTVALPLRDLAFALVISTAIFWYVEAEKWWLRRAARS